MKGLFLLPNLASISVMPPHRKTQRTSQTWSWCITNLHTRSLLSFRYTAGWSNICCDRTRL